MPLALVVLMLVGVIPSTATEPATLTRPTLALRSFGPVTIAGTRFRGREQVRVTVNRLRTVRVTADRTGRFTATFPGIRVPRCGTFFVRAVGSAGSRASLELPLPECFEP